MVIESESKPKRKISRLRYAISAVVLMVLALVLASFALFGYVGNYEVVSNSMVPTLFRGDRVLVDQRPHYVPQVGDVIAFEDPEKPSELLTKRVAAVEGQTVDFAEGYILVDGQKWRAPGQLPIELPPSRRIERVKIRPGEMFVLGDNALESEDSTSFGPIPTHAIKGQLWFVYWPLSHVGKVH